MQIRHPLYRRITMDPDKCFGKPCVRGLRFPVASILAYLGSGMSIDEMLEEWPELEREDVLEALAFASSALEERILPAASR